MDSADSNTSRIGVETIVVNYNAGKCLVDCIEKLRSQVDRTIVVDNGSSDNSLITLKKLSSGEGRLCVIANSANLGFAAACNIGIRYLTDAPYVLFLNPDCMVEKNAVDRLLHTIETDPAIGMVGGLLLNPDGSEQAGARRAIPTPWRSFVRAFGLARFAERWPRLFADFHLHNKPLPSNPVEVEATSGACMMVRREAMDDVGLWDEGYFLHCEDLDWCMRFRQKRWKVVFVPSARMVHIHGVSGKGRKLFVEWHKHKGMVRFYRKFFRHQYPGILMLLVAIGVWLRFSLITAFCTGRRIRNALGFRHA